MYKIYASHASGNTWPALSTEAGRLTPIPDDIHPEYLYSPDYFICPGPVPILPEPFLDDQHYVYLGYMLQDDADAVNFATAYTAQLAGGGDFTGDLTATASYGSGTELLRLKEGMERFLITDINNPPVNLNTPSTIPVMIEWPGNHDGATGGHVLYMDGRTEWIAYPGKWPMTTTTIAALDSIANWTPSTEWPQWEPYSISPDDPYRFKGSCESNLKQLGLVGRMYADEHGEIWPALPTEAGLLMMPEADLYHEYLHASEVTLCPAAITEDPPPFWEDRHYVYLGYFMMNDADVQAFADAYTAQLAGGGDFTTNLNTPSSYGDHLLRLENGLERFLITDINSPTLPYLGLKSTVPVMIEWPDNHENLSGGHVLYLDGHVEWHDYPGEWPMTEATITTLDGIATWIRSTEWATREFASDTGDPHKLLVCGSNVKNFGLMMKIYANDNRGSYYPDLNPTADKLTFIADQVGPHYLRDFRKMNCPGSPKALKIPVMDDHSYAYLGYLVQDETELQQFAAAYRAQIAAGGDFSEDLDFGGETILRIREGIERFLITDINNPAAANAHQADIPVLVEWPDNHGNLRGGWVLYMDGHAEWFDYPSTFPMTEEAMAILTDLAGRPPIAAPEPARDSSRLTDLLLQDGESTRR